MSEKGAALLSDRFEEALCYAAQLHAHQTRKVSSVPYIAHLMSVTALVLEDGGSETEAVAALLHDAVEDQGGQDVLDEIRRRFGAPVAEIVEACSDAFEMPKPPWQQRKEAHIQHLRNASPSVLRVINADKLHNARTLLRDLQMDGNAIWDKFNGEREGSLWYYRSLYEVLAEKRSGYLVEELGRVLDQIEKLAAAE